jgi:hypothetical protein
MADDKELAKRRKDGFHRGWQRYLNDLNRFCPKPTKRRSPRVDTYV